MIKKNYIIKVIAVIVTLCTAIFIFCNIYKCNLYKTYNDILIKYNIANKKSDNDNVLREEAVVSISKILGATDLWATYGINGSNPALIEGYSDYPDFAKDYDKVSLGYMGLVYTVVAAIDIEKYGYPIKLRPKDYITQREALEYILVCVENENANKNKSIINRALYEKIIGLSDLISFADLDKPIDRKQYNKLMYNLLCHRRYLYLEKGNIFIQHDLDSYSGTSITYKEYLDSIQSAMTDK